MSIVDRQEIRPIMKNMSVIAMAFAIPMSCVYNIAVEVHRYFSVHVELILCLFCRHFLSRCHMPSLVIRRDFDAVWRRWYVKS